MLTVKEKTCTGCRICEQVCSMEHHREFNSSLSRVRVISNWPAEEKIIICRQCKTRACVEACPQNALTFDGFVVLDEERCNGCGECLAACPFGFNLTNPANNKPLFCDTCSGKYLCVNWCPSKAIRKGGK